MSDDASTTDTTTTTDAATTDAAGATFTQEQVNSFLAEQKRKIGDVKELKAAAAELATIKESQKTDAQKTADRLAAADTEVASIPAKIADALRTHLVELHKIPSEDAELFLNASDPVTLLKQVDRLMARESASTADRKKQGNYVRKEGTTSHSQEDPNLNFLRSLTGRD